MATIAISVYWPSGTVILDSCEFDSSDLVSSVLASAEVAAGKPLVALVAPAPRADILAKEQSIQSYGLMTGVTLTAITAEPPVGLYAHEFETADNHLMPCGSHERKYRWFSFEIEFSLANKFTYKFSDKKLVENDAAYVASMTWQYESRVDVNGNGTFKFRLSDLAISLDFEEGTKETYKSGMAEEDIPDKYEKTNLAGATESGFFSDISLKQITMNDYTLAKMEDADDLSSFLLARSQGIEAALPHGYETGFGVIGHEATGITLRCPPLRVGPQTEDSLVLYHYCPEEPFKLILGNKDTKYIRRSCGKRAHHGDGVYATCKPPHQFSCKDDILKNNYTNKTCPLEQEGQIAEWRAKGAVDFCIPIVLPRAWASNASNGQNMRGDPVRAGRDIWVINCLEEVTAPVLEEDEAVYDRLSDVDWSIRKDAVEMLRGPALAGYRRAWKKIWACLRDDEPQVRVAAIWVAAEAGWVTAKESLALENTEAARKIRSLLSDESEPIVIKEAREALELFGGLDDGGASTPACLLL